jgi:parvulin-like peptidyl-prolyl isomerase
MQHLRRTIGATIALIVLLGAGQCLAQEDEQIMATVNGQPILAEALEDALYKRWGDIALGSLIQELAVEQAAAEAGIEVSEEEIAERADRFRRNIDMKSGNNGNFSMWLARQKMTPYAFRQWIRTEYLLEKMVADEATVTDEEVKAYYDQQQERFQQPERMRVSHICVTDKAEAEQIREEILGGTSFDEAAQDYSIDPYTRDKGGEFGVITPGESAFQRAAFGLQDDGAMTEPVKTEKGWHIIRRDEHMPAGCPSYEEIKDQLRAQLEQQKLMGLMNEKRGEIMQNARVEQEIEPAELASE